MIDSKESRILTIGDPHFNFLKDLHILEKLESELIQLQPSIGCNRF